MSKILLQESKILQRGETGLTYIYSLSDPITNEIRYVGKSDNPNLRLIEHIKKCKYSTTHKNNWIKSLLNRNLKPIVEVLDVISIKDCGFWENYWINTVKTWGFDLTNIANGGIGGNLGPIVNAKISEKLKNRMFSAETIENMRISATNRRHSEKTISKMAISKMGDNNPMFGKARIESSKKYRSVVQLDLNRNLIKPWQGVSIASKELKINRCTISDVCNGRKKTAGGYVWEYSQ
jgi:group I intron endonuclease